MPQRPVPAKISVVVPVCNEEKNVAELSSAVLAQLASLDAEPELIFIDDGSSDNTLAEIKRIALQQKNVFFISLSRNFGHQNALRAGLDMATGDVVITMDGDMQHPPEMLIKMIEKWRNGNDIVCTVRHDTNETSWFKRNTSAVFYWLMNQMTGINMHKGSADFRLLDRKAVDALKSIRENNIFYRGLVSWAGFRQCSIEYVPSARIHGRSKYSLRKMFRLALDGITAFSFLPLRLAAAAGFFIAFLSFLYVLYAIFIKMFTAQAVSGWVSLMAGVYFLGGVQLIFIGLCGEYIGRIFMEVKRRPHYLVSEAKLPNNPLL
ncbi:MAG: glycosyltransferase family 2 protein [Candidatus Electronema sp. V4]|uniref:glycosyltransferase family 2 protein n=1 Tax=Candidatus Electronema sp. V4 TaxID=3454756 RepID=UPI0040559731